MPPKLALLFCTIFVLAVLRLDRWRTTNVSKALYWPVLWYLVASSHPIGVWFDVWGLPLPGGGDSVADGSLLDRLFYGALAVIGIYVLAGRKLRWSVITQENRWLTILLVYLFISCAWSDFPMVSIKRFVKLFGALIMALVVLTDENRVDAISTVIRRVVYIHVPMSILCTRYFRELGVSWDYMGTTSSWTGIASSKNILGQVAMLGAICFIWERVRRGNPKQGRWVDFVYIAMSCYLLKGEEGRISMTSITVFGLALFIFLALQRAKNDLYKAMATFKRFLYVIYALLIFVSWHSIFPFSEHSLFGFMITVFGRDITLTGRTDIWSDMYHVASRNPLMGVGFGGFWIGRIANIPWNAEMSWILGEGHNGYIDTYLQSGLIGVGLLMAVLFSSVGKIQRSFIEDFEYGRFCAIVFCVILYVDITESAYLRGDHNLWLIFLLTAVSAPRYAWASAPLPQAKKTAKKDQDREEDEMEDDPYRMPVP